MFSLDDMYRTRGLEKGKWHRTLNFTGDAFCTIVTEKYVIKITGGSIVILSKSTGEILNKLKGYHYLYTGDVNPDETELFALENGKHFYIISLQDYLQKRRVTLPRSYDAIDVYGTYSEDGKSLIVPVNKYVNNKYRYWLCEYETESYTLVKMEEIEAHEVNCWLNI